MYTVGHHTRHAPLQQSLPVRGARRASRRAWPWSPSASCRVSCWGCLAQVMAPRWRRRRRFHWNVHVIPMIFPWYFGTGEGKKWIYLLIQPERKICELFLCCWQFWLWFLRNFMVCCLPPALTKRNGYHQQNPGIRWWFSGAKRIARCLVLWSRWTKRPLMHGSIIITVREVTHPKYWESIIIMMICYIC